MEIVDSIGNRAILKLPKTAFLCSRKVPASAVLKCYDWAIEQREKGNCVISGFHSKLEKDVLHYLLKGKQPVILALARGLKKRYNSTIKCELDKGRLLIVTPFEDKIVKVTSYTSRKRNLFMSEIADRIVIGYQSEKSSLSEITKLHADKISYLV